MVQDLATQQLQSYPCETKTSQETQKSLMKLLEPSQKPKVIYTDNSIEVGKSCENLSWNHCTSTPHTSETRKGHLQYCCNPDWMMNGGQILRNAVAICEMSKTSWQEGRLLMKDHLKNHSMGQQFLLEQWLDIYQSPRDKKRIHQFGKKVLPGFFLHML